jgi:predicted membrane protein
MQALNRALYEWFAEAYSAPLLFLVIALVGVVRHLVRHADTLPARRFVRLAVLGAVLALLAVGAAFRTHAAAALFGLSAGAMSDKVVGWSKAGLALSATWLSVREATNISAPKPIRACWSKGIALGLAVVALGAYFRYGDYGYVDFYHRHEFFHYYLGPKYNREVGYERLYPCVAVAQAESGQINEVKVRKMMDLATDVIVPAKRALEHPDACRDHFTPERWESFKSDVRFFRSTSSLDYWNGMQTDHGYNPPPVWTAIGYFWSTLAPPSTAYFKFLASFDLLLWGGMFVAVYWAFGWRVFAVAAIYFGCQAAAEYSWTGGAFLRQDWLFWLVLSACLVRRRWYALGGAAFAYATLLRVFPGVLLIGWLVVIGAHFRKHRRIAAHHMRVLVGGVAATALLVSLSIAVTGPSAYADFYRHIQVHNHSPLSNNMGLATVLSQSYAGRMAFNWNPKALDPVLKWQELRRDRLHAMQPLQMMLVVGLGVAFVAVVRRVKSLWIAEVLALAVVVAVVELTDYYYSMFLLAALLSRHRRGVEQWVLCIAGASQLLAVNRFFSSYFDDLYTALSVLYCLFALSLLGAYWRKRGTRGKALARAAATT